MARKLSVLVLSKVTGALREGLGRRRAGRPTRPTVPGRGVPPPPDVWFDAAVTTIDSDARPNTAGARDGVRSTLRPSNRLHSAALEAASFTAIEGGRRGGGREAHATLVSAAAAAIVSIAWSRLVSRCVLTTCAMPEDAMRPSLTREPYGRRRQYGRQTLTHWERRKLVVDFSF
ncbi:hypothetical protein B296_00037018 [Ensete ventricosum]|uniref:Uncharacterized protein n=1 Tax=Ensete ventricosum TaxID=4639 RepID=A0A427A0M8_ENSVE|nr:hypothetical protein B296_00037018 [Ensete ventricosum]